MLDHFNYQNYKSQGTISAKIRCRYCAILRYIHFKFDKRIKYIDSSYTIWSLVLGDGINVDGYYAIISDKHPDGMAIAFILSETKQLVFYW